MSIPDSFYYDKTKTSKASESLSVFKPGDEEWRRIRAREQRKTKPQTGLSKEKNDFEAAAKEVEKRHVAEAQEKKPSLFGLSSSAKSRPTTSQKAASTSEPSIPQELRGRSQARSPADQEGAEPLLAPPTEGEVPFVEPLEEASHEAELPPSLPSSEGEEVAVLLPSEPKALKPTLSPAPAPVELPLASSQRIAADQGVGTGGPVATPLVGAPPPKGGLPAAKPAAAPAAPLIAPEGAAPAGPLTAPLTAALAPPSPAPVPSAAPSPAQTVAAAPLNVASPLPREQAGGSIKLSSPLLVNTVGEVSIADPLAEKAPPLEASVASGKEEPLLQPEKEIAEPLTVGKEAEPLASTTKPLVSRATFPTSTEQEETVAYLGEQKPSLLSKAPVAPLTITSQGEQPSSLLSKASGSAAPQPLFTEGKRASLDPPRAATSGMPAVQGEQIAEGESLRVAPLVEAPLPAEGTAPAAPPSPSRLEAAATLLATPPPAAGTPGSKKAPHGLSSAATAHLPPLQDSSKREESLLAEAPLLSEKTTPLATEQEAPEPLPYRVELRVDQREVERYRTIDGQQSLAAVAEAELLPVLPSSDEKLIGGAARQQVAEQMTSIVNAAADQRPEVELSPNLLSEAVPPLDLASPSLVGSPQPPVPEAIIPGKAPPEGVLDLAAELRRALEPTREEKVSEMAQAKPTDSRVAPTASQQASEVHAEREREAPSSEDRRLGLTEGETATVSLPAPETKQLGALPPVETAGALVVPLAALEQGRPTAVEQPSVAQRPQLAPSMIQIIEQIAKEIQVLRQGDMTETTITLSRPPLFHGVQVTITSYEQAPNELNIRFSNMTIPGKRIIDENLMGLRAALEGKEKGIIIHQLYTTTLEEPRYVAAQRSSTPGGDRGRGHEESASEEEEGST